MPTPSQCLLAPTLLALRGEGPPPHPVVLEPPAVLLEAPLPPPPGGGKGVYGGRLANHVDSTNFTVAWRNGDGDEAAAELASEALEQAWSALIEDQGWPEPVSSDTFLLWVLLDPSLNGTGLTVPYVTSEYPEGYPVIFLNPDYANSPDFFQSLAAHEFMHAIQFAMRDYYLGDEESWYWEASAEWAAELALPSVDAYAYQSRYYARNTELRYSSEQDSHPYGMFVLNAYIEEHLLPGGMQDIWRDAQGHDGEDWDELISESLGTTPAYLWGGFTGAMGAGDLAEFALYEPPARVGALTDGAGDTLAYLGTHYYDVNTDTGVRVSGDALLSSGGTWADELVLARGDTLAVTGLADAGTRYTLELFTPEDDSGDDSGLGGADDTGDVGGKPLDPPGTCAVGVGAGSWMFGFLMLCVRRRRSV